MSKLVLFKDLRKRSNDLLTKDFLGDKSEKKLEWKGQSPSGVTLEVFFNEDKGNITGKLKPKYNIKAYNAEVTGEFSTKQEGFVEGTVQDQLFKGLKTIVSLNKKKDLYGLVGAEYKHSHAYLNGTIDYGKAEGPTFNGAAVVGTEGYSLGLNATYLFSKSALQDFELVASYRTSELDASAFGRARSDEKTKKEVQEVGVAFFHEVSSDLHFGTEGVFNVTTKIPELKAGLQLKVTPDTTLKAKFNNVGQLALTYQQQFNKLTKFTLSSTIDLQAWQSGKQSTTFGLGLNFTA